MTDLKLLTQSLERAADRTEVGPAPIEQIRAGARRTSRRRVTALAAAAVAVVVGAVAGSAVLSTPDNEQRPSAPGTSSAADPSTSGKPSSRTDLEGSWMVRALVGQDGQSVLPEADRGKVRLTFADGELTGTTGCNDIFGTYEQSGTDGQDLRFPREALGSTLVGCDEAPLVERLLDVRYVSGSGNVRTLHAQNWMIVVQLKRAGSKGPPADRGSLTDAEYALAVDTAERIQSEVEGTFVGATAIASEQHRPPCDKDAGCPHKRLVYIRLVWDADANIVHSGPVTRPDGRHKALLIAVDPDTDDIVSRAAVYWSVAPDAAETLLYGQRL